MYTGNFQLFTQRAQTDEDFRVLNFVEKVSAQIDQGVRQGRSVFEVFPEAANEHKHRILNSSLPNAVYMLVNTNSHGEQIDAFWSLNQHAFK